MAFQRESNRITGNEQGADCTRVRGRNEVNGQVRKDINVGEQQQQIQIMALLVPGINIKVRLIGGRIRGITLWVPQYKDKNGKMD